MSATPSADYDALRNLVSDWQANGNSRPLGDPTADTWHECARQLLSVISPEDCLCLGVNVCSTCDDRKGGTYE